MASGLSVARGQSTAPTSGLPTTSAPQSKPPSASSIASSSASIGSPGLPGSRSGPKCPEALEPVRVGPAASSLDLRRERIGSVVWATGYRRRYPWLNVPVLNDGGEIVHHGGITPCPGLFAIGLRLLRRRNSSFLDGVGRDAEELTIHILAHLGQTRRLAA